VRPIEVYHKAAKKQLGAKLVYKAMRKESLVLCFVARMVFN